MNKFIFKFTSLAGMLALALLLTGGCGKGTPKLTSEQSKAFDNAPAEVKQTWDKALAAEKADDYVAAQNAFDALKSMYLSDPQSKALETESGAFGLRLWNAAQKNDPAAIKAVQQINDSKGSRRVANPK